ASSHSCHPVWSPPLRNRTAFTGGVDVLTNNNCTAAGPPARIHEGAASPHLDRLPATNERPKMGKVKTNKARKPKSDGTECSAEVVALLKKIAAEQKTVDGQEANAVAAVLRISLHLAELRPLAKKTWAKQLGAIGMCPRVASRYLKIAKSGLA